MVAYILPVRVDYSLPQVIHVPLMNMFSLGNGAWKVVADYSLDEAKLQTSLSEK
jgi:hypothetical protein